MNLILKIATFLYVVLEPLLFQIQQMLINRINNSHKNERGLRPPTFYPISTTLVDSDHCRRNVI